MFRSGRVIQNRLDKLQLDRVETAADGSCQFVALTLSAGIALDAFAFRTQVVGYLRSTATFFKNDIDRSFPSFESSGYHEFGGHVGRRPDASGRIPPPNPRRERPRHGERTLFLSPSHYLTRDLWKRHSHMSRYAESLRSHSPEGQGRKEGAVTPVRKHSLQLDLSHSRVLPQGPT